MNKRIKSGQKKRAFTLVELLLSILIMGIVGGVAVMALQIILLSFAQNDDYIAARSEVEFAFNELRPQFTNIGLGMPNSRSDASSTGSFTKAFSGLTLVTGDYGMTEPVKVSGASKDVLYYAYAEPTGVRIKRESTTTELQLFSTADVNKLTSHDFQPDTSKENAYSWILFPSLRVPFHVTPGSGTTLNVSALPAGFKVDINGYEEIHVLRVGKIYVVSEELRLETNGAASPQVLARNIKSVSFENFDSNKRTLTMIVTALSNPGKDKQVITESMIWRIIN